MSADDQYINSPIPQQDEKLFKIQRRLNGIWVNESGGSNRNLTANQAKAQLALCRSWTRGYGVQWRIRPEFKRTPKGGA